MKIYVQEIYNAIDRWAPFSTAMDFDNPGLLIGGPEQPVTGIVTTLDVTFEAISFAKSKGANLIISHHPVIFHGLKRISANSMVYRLIQEGIAVISAHTNLDAAPDGVNDTLCAKLGLRDVTAFHPLGAGPQGPVFLGRLGALAQPVSALQLASLVKKALGRPAVGLVEGNGLIMRVAVCSGSGGDLWQDAKEAGAEALVTSEIKQNYAIDAQAVGFTMVDAGHYDTEVIICKVIEKYLKDQFPELGVWSWEGSPTIRME